MVFGWGKKKQEEPEISTKKVTLDQIDSILSRKKEELKKKIAIQSKPMFSEIQSELNSIYKIIDHLKNDDLKVDDIEKILRVIVVRAKTEVIDVISKESKKPLPSVSTYEDVLKTQEAASYTLKKIGDVLGKHSRVIHVFAKKYAQDLKDHLELVTEDNLRISRMLGDYSALESSSGMIKEMISKMNASAQEIADIKNHIIKLQESDLAAQKLYESTQKQITDARTSSEYLQHLEIKNKIQQIKSQEERLDREIDDEFSKISRPLGKYVYVTSLEKSLKSILERLVEQPSKMIATESKASIITILESCMKGIVSGTVSVKETDKSVVHITHLMSSLDSMIAKKAAIQSQIQEVEKQALSFDRKKLESLEKQLAKSKSDSEDAQAKIKNLQSELDQKSSQRQKLASDLESTLARLGIQCEVN
jgi:predicted  nucleic acid-binding Zn-ribbon protein